MGVKLQSSSGGSVEIAAPVTASNYTLTAPAANGTIQTTTGSGAGLTGLTGAQGASTTLLGSASANNTSSISFTGLSGGSYSAYRLIIDSIQPVTNNVHFILRISTGSGFLTSNYAYGVWRWTSAGSGVGGDVSTATAIALSSGVETCGNANNTYTSAYDVLLFGADSTVPVKRVAWSATGLWTSGTMVHMSGGGQILTHSVVIDGVSLLMSSGNIAQGTVRLYGIKNA